MVQISALTAILELCRGGKGAVFEPTLFCQALELLFCSLHASAEVLQVLNVSFLEYSDIRYPSCKHSIHSLSAQPL